MARITESVFKNWEDGETVKAADYKQEREIMRTAINDFDNDVKEIQKMNIGPQGPIGPQGIPGVGSVKQALKKDLPVLSKGELGLAEDTKDVYIGTPTGNELVGGASVMSQLAEKANKGEIAVSDIDKNKGLIDQTYLTDGLKQQIAGTAPINAVPADYSLTENKFAVPVVLGRKSNNLFNKDTTTQGYYLSTTGTLVSSAAWSVSDYMPVDPSTQYSFYPTSFIGYYDVAKKFISGVSTITSPITTPANTAYMRIGYKMVDYDRAMVNKGATLLPYEKYGTRVDGNKLEFKSISKDKLDFLALEGMPSPNLFNKDTVTQGYYLGANGSLVAASSWATSDFIKGKPSSQYSFTPTSFIAYYDGAKTFISKTDTITSPITTPSNAEYFKICFKIIDLEIAMLNEGASLLSYESFGTKLATTPKKDIEIIVPYNIYTVANDIGNNPVFGRNYSASLVIDHMININEYDKDIKFKGKGDSFTFQAPFVNDGTDTGYIINGGVTAKKTHVTIDFESKDFNVASKQVTHISTRASAGKSKKSFVLTIGDSLTNDHLSGSYRIDEVKPGQLVYWAKVKKLFELDKIDGGDNSNEYNIFMLGKKTRKTIAVDYKSKSRIVTANGEGYGGWSLYSILRHQDRINGSQETWDLLGLGNGSGTDYTGSAAQKDLIASTNQVYTGLPVNPFFDNNKTGSNRFSIAKWLERYRTMDDNGNRLTLGIGTGTEITSANLNTIDVCTPTHVVIQMGANDLGRTTDDKFLANLQEFCNTIRTDYPSMIIGISLHPDYAGTYFPSRFPEFDNCKIDRAGHGLHFESAKKILSWFNGKDEVTEKLFLIPSFFVQPNAYSMPYIKYDAPESDSDELLKNKGYLIKYGAGPDIHPNYNAHAAWAYQMYAWLKYTLSLS